MAYEIAKGRMYATKEVIELQKELQSYKDAEEQGLLLRLPCKVGEEVYCVVNHIGYYTIEKNRVLSYQTAPKGVDGIIARGYMGTSLGIVGKNVFATLEEAGQALAKMKGE